ncbi:dynein heavy chain [Angomonas deanei]|nr:dynein heavy chain [Angomonas deanei]|eukprot:EPY43885.1 dynein heavy chain [Angomonas deanei]
MLAAQGEREQQNVQREDDNKRNKKKKVLDTRDTGAQQQPSYIEMGQRMATCKRLTAFIKLCDYILITCLTKLAEKALENMKIDLQYPKERTAAVVEQPAAGKEKNAKKKEEVAFTGTIFKGEIVFNEEERTIEIVPPHSSVIESVEDIIRDYVRTVGGVPRLVSMDTFKVYTDQAQENANEVSGGPEVAEMVVSESVYKTNVSSIRESIAATFSDVDDYVHTFEPFREMYLTNEALDTDLLLEKPQTLEFFRAKLSEYKAQMEAISSKIPDHKDVALVTVFTESFREFMIPSPVSCLEGFHKVLPVIVHRQNERLLEELQTVTTYLSATPKTVEHYVEYLKYYKELEERFDTIAADFDFTKDLFNLLQEEKIEVSDDDMETYRSGTRPQFDKLRTLMQVTEDGKESQQRHFARNIDEQMDQLRRNIETVYDKAGQSIVSDENSDIEEVIAYISSLQKEAEGIATREKELRGYQITIGAEETTVDTMNDMLNDVNMKYKLWVGVRDWTAFVEETRQVPVDELSVTSVQDTVQQYTTLVKQVSSKLPNNGVVPMLKSNVEEWRELTPVLQAITNPKLKSDHTAKISQIVGEVEVEDGTAKTMAEWGSQLTVGMLLDNNVIQYREELIGVSAAAIEEDKLQQQIDKVSAQWTGGGPKPPMEFQFHNHKDVKDSYTLVGASVEDTLALLDDTLISISTIASSKFCQGLLKAQVERWDSRLKYMQETLDLWVELQRQWIYLENIFSSSEIRSQWKDDAKRFEKVDRFFRDLMRKAHDQPTAYRALLINAPSFDSGESADASKSLKKDLDGNIKELEKVLYSLEKKLEEKRRAFPRFYFLSNDDLLDILAKVKTPELMMPHMLKMFDGIKSLAFADGNDITHLISMEGERVELVNKNVKARGPVDSWMDMLEREMLTTLRRHAQTCLEDFEERGDRSNWMFQHPVQLVLMMEQLLWTRSVEEALDKPDSEQRMLELKSKNYALLDELASLTGRKLSKVQRVLLSTMITIDVHGRDLVDEMCDNKVIETKEFGWQKQLRVYWEKDDDDYGNMFIRQNNSRFVYGYEYLGAQGRLVITPLTDRIYMTVTGALKLYLGASPSGPAGTGKTETVKDLAKNLARQCIVYNCSDGVTYKMMEKFFSGLIQTGAWACLDEFNRINIEVLSVIASQILEIKLALQNKKDSFTFQGTPDVRVRPTYGSFVTMNPGYAGRTELPDNLKILFRPVAVMTPDFRMIAEVILYSEGFKNAKDLSLKITQLYKLSSEQLSPQDHYDFGMRALKSILVMAGDLKRSQPDVTEDLTLIVACNDSNVPKFVAEDIPLFNGIMQDLFPGVSFPKREYTELLPVIQRYMDKKKLVDVGAWVQKSIQFYETLIVRHGVMLVGWTGTGKTEIRESIASALISMCEAGSSNPVAQQVHQFKMNPKAVLMHELYGQLDVNTNEWKDGVLAAIAKSCVRDSEGSKDHRWIVFDGPVDTLWIESLNSVLDDSKLLCLDSGERIKLPETIHMLFEVADLAVASPATVSRCGMVYVDTSDLPWIGPVRQWSETSLASSGAPPQCREYVVSLFETYVPKGLEWLAQQKTLMHAGNTNVIQSMCDLYTSLIQSHKLKFAADPAETLPHDDPSFTERNELCNALFAFSYIWSIGANVSQEGMDSFDTLARSVLERVVRFPGGGNVYDYTIDFKTRLFVGWDVHMKEFVYNVETPFFNILVPTVDTVRYSTLAKTLIQCGKPVLFNGQTGVGKSVILSDCLNTNKEELQLALVSFQFSAQTSSERTQLLLESKLKQKRKNILGAPPGKRIALFIDDLNMPALEEFGASPPIELIRQLMGSGGFYDRKIAGFWKRGRT